MVRVQIADHFPRVTMDYPPVNALNAELPGEMIRAFDPSAGYRGFQGSDACLHREAQAGVQGTLKGLYLVL
jgi:hypothetical protein